MVVNTVGATAVGALGLPDVGESPLLHAKELAIADVLAVERETLLGTRRAILARGIPLRPVGAS